MYVDRDKEAFADELYQANDSVQVLRLIGSMGLNPGDLASGIGVESEHVQRWYEGDADDVEEHAVAIESLRSVTLFLLRRGIMSAPLTGLWLKEPNSTLDMTPLAAIAKEGGIDEVIKASTTFTRPEVPPRDY